MNVNNIYNYISLQLSFPFIPIPFPTNESLTLSLHPLCVLLPLLSVSTHFHHIYPFNQPLLTLSSTTSFILVHLLLCLLKHLTLITFSLFLYIFIIARIPFPSYFHLFIMLYTHRLLRR